MATSEAQVKSFVEDGSQRIQPLSPDRDRITLRLGALAGVLGLVVQIVMGHLHPSHADPNDSVAAFKEYSLAHGWTAVHMGQFLGTVLIAFGLAALYRSLSSQPGMAGTFARVGGLAVIVLVGVFAVQMAVDGVALKRASDVWVAATGPAKTSAFQVAEGIRWIEKGLSGFFHLLNGTALVAFGLSIVVGRVYRPWLGFVGIAAGLGFLAGGAVTAHTGFSSEAGTVLTPSLVLLLVFLGGAGVSMWRRAKRLVPDAIRGAAGRGTAR